LEKVAYLAETVSKSLLSCPFRKSSFGYTAVCKQEIVTCRGFQVCGSRPNLLKLHRLIPSRALIRSVVKDAPQHLHANWLQQKLQKTHPVRAYMDLPLFRQRGRNACRMSFSGCRRAALFRSFKRPFTACCKLLL